MVLRIMMAALLLLASAGHSAAQDNLAAERDALVKKMTQQAEERFWQMRDKFEPPIDESKANARQIFTLPEKESQFVFEVGMTNAAAQWCGLEWKPTYLQFRKWQKQRDWNPYQLGFVDYFHGMVYGFASKMLEEQSCKAAQKTKTQERLTQLKSIYAN